MTWLALVAGIGLGLSVVGGLLLGRLRTLSSQLAVLSIAIRELEDTLAKLTDALHKEE